MSKVKTREINSIKNEFHNRIFSHALCMDNRTAILLCELYEQLDVLTFKKDDNCPFELNVDTSDDEIDEA